MWDDNAHLRFVSEHAAIVDVNGDLIIDGTPRLRILRGSLVGDHHSRLFRLLDGTRTLSQIESEVPEIPPNRLRAVLASLAEAGLLEECSGESVRPDTNLDALQYFRRVIGVTGWNSSGVAAYEKLRTNRVFIVDQDDTLVPKLLCDVLLRTGVAAELICKKSLFGCLPAPGGASARSFLVYIERQESDESWHGSLDELCARSNITLVRVAANLNYGQVDFGPLFGSHPGSCYACFLMENPVRDGTVNQERSKRSEPKAALWAGMIGLELIYQISRAAPPVAINGFRRYDLNSWEFTDIVVPRTRCCAQCQKIFGGADTGSGKAPEMFTAVAFSDSIRTLAREYLDPSSGKLANRVGSRLIQEAKHYSVCSQIALDRGVCDDETALAHSLGRAKEAGPTSGIALTSLSLLLQLTAGIRRTGRLSQEVRRWAATAGNLGSVELYVVALNVAGLEPGIYFYQPKEHSLAVLKRMPRSGTRRLLTRLLGPQCPDIPDAVVVFTGALHRLMRKYGPFGLLLSWLDSGAAINQCGMIADELGMSLEGIFEAIDAVAQEELSMMDQQKEVCTGVIAVFADCRRGKATPVRHSGDRTRNHYRSLPGILRNRTRLSLLEALLYESRTDRARTSSLSAPPETGRDAAAPESEGHSTPAHPSSVSGPLASLPLVLLKRRSKRRFGPVPVTAAQLGTIIRAASAAQGRWGVTSVASALTYHVLAISVSDMDPGVYSCGTDAPVLAWSHNLPSQEQIRALMTQDEFASAPVQIWIAGDIKAQCEEHGSWGYGRLLREAGASAHQIVMTALAAGLEGTIIAGLIGGSAETHLGLDGHRRCGLCAVALGSPG